jgi:DNA-directed RNA polymerase specialized sigma24 family protein
VTATHVAARQAAPRDLDEVRSAATRGAISSAKAELDKALTMTVQSNAIPALQLRDLERAIAKLPPEQREVILLVGLSKGWLMSRSAKVLNVPVGTVRSRLSRGREQLRRLMDVGEERSQRAGREDTDHRHAA